MEAAGCDAAGVELWKWPAREDCIVYPIGQVVQAIAVPVPHAHLFKLRSNEVYIVPN